MQKRRKEQVSISHLARPYVVVRCVRPDIRVTTDFTIHDPAIGTAGFLIGAYEWTMNQTKKEHC